MVLSPYMGGLLERLHWATTTERRGGTLAAKGGRSGLIQINAAGEIAGMRELTALQGSITLMQEIARYRIASHSASKSLLTRHPQ